MSTNSKAEALAQAVEATEAAYNAATEELGKLKTEQKELPALIAAAAHRGDSAEMIRLKKRQMDLLAHLFAADVTARQKKVEMFKAKHQIAREVQGEAEKLFAKRAPEIEREYREAEAQMKARQLERMQLSGDQDQKQQIARELAQRIQDQTRDLSAFIDREAGVNDAPPLPDGTKQPGILVVNG
jgi:glutaredoxin 2